MYGYENPETNILRIPEVLSRIDQEQVFYDLLGFRPQEQIKIRSPFRADKSGDAFFLRAGGQLRFVDFADTKRATRDCIDAVMELKGMNLSQALNYLNNTYHLGIGKPEGAKPILQDITPVTKQTLPMDYCPRLFNEKDKEYWFDRYGITRQQLYEDKVYAFKWFLVYSFKKKDYVTVSPKTLCYGLTGFREGFMKIYCPLEQNRKFKWTSNCNEDDIGNIDNLPLFGKQLILTKAYKCHRVLRNHNSTPCCWLQNETCVPSEELLQSLCQRFTDIVLFYDNDEAGIKGANKLKERFNNIHPGKASIVFAPDFNGTVKDPSDFKEHRGSKELTEFLHKYVSNNATKDYSSIMGDTSTAPF